MIFINILHTFLIMFFNYFTYNRTPRTKPIGTGNATGSSRRRSVFSVARARTFSNPNNTRNSRRHYWAGNRHHEKSQVKCFLWLCQWQLQFCKAVGGAPLRECRARFTVGSRRRLCRLSCLFFFHITFFHSQGWKHLQVEAAVVVAAKFEISDGVDETTILLFVRFLALSIRRLLPVRLLLSSLSSWWFFSFIFVRWEFCLCRDRLWIRRVVSERQWCRWNEASQSSLSGGQWETRNVFWQKSTKLFAAEREPQPGFSRARMPSV